MTELKVHVLRVDGDEVTVTGSVQSINKLIQMSHYGEMLVQATQQTELLRSIADSLSRIAGKDTQ